MFNEGRLAPCDSTGCPGTQAGQDVADDRAPELVGLDRALLAAASPFGRADDLLAELMADASWGDEP